MTTPRSNAAAKRPLKFSVPLVLVIATLGLGLIGAALFVHARGDVNAVALASLPKPVSVVEAQATTFRPNRRYVGTLLAWNEAKVGPQLISSYVDTVLVRPGAVVKRGDVIATLDCRNASATEKAIAMQARSIEATQAAITNEASRISSLLDGGFASPNEVEQKNAESSSKQAQLMAVQAQMLGSSLQVSDCILRAPFDGEIAERQVDPGAFVRPGMAIATIVDRSTVRVAVNVPEEDFEAVAPGTPVKLTLLATGKAVTGTVSRRAPAADASTRDVYCEVDLPNADHSLPVGTTAELSIDVGEVKPCTGIPLFAATVRQGKATVFVVEAGVAQKKVFAVVGEREGQLFVEPALAAGTPVVTEGRRSLHPGEAVKTGP